MNLIQKLTRYLKLRKMGMSHHVAWREFKDYPLIKDDYIGIGIFILCAVLLIVIVSENDMNNKMEIARVALIKKQSANYFLAHQTDRCEKKIVTMLNGDYIRLDGVKRKVKLCDAAGVCDD